MVGTRRRLRGLFAIFFCLPNDVSRRAAGTAKRAMEEYRRQQQDPFRGSSCVCVGVAPMKVMCTLDVACEPSLMFEAVRAQILARCSIELSPSGESFARVALLYKHAGARLTRVYLYSTVW